MGRASTRASGVKSNRFINLAMIFAIAIQLLVFLVIHQFNDLQIEKSIGWIGY